MAKKEKIKIGWAEADITPRGKCELAGQYYQRVSRGIHSPLSAIVLALQSESGEQAVMISIDLVGFPREFLNHLRERVRRLVPAIIPEKIMMNAIHTHNAPAVYTGLEWWQSDPDAVKPEDYRNFVLARVAAAVQSAWQNLAPGRIAPAGVPVVLGHCRRAVYSDGHAEMYGDTSRADFTGMEGNEDSGVELLFTYDANKKPTGVIVNAACPSQVMEATCMVSSDFAGECRCLLKKRFGKKFYALYQVSSAGDQSPRDLIRNRNADLWSARGAAILGERLASAVVSAANAMPTKGIRARIEMAHKVRSVVLPGWLPDERVKDAAEKEMRRLEASMSSRNAYADFTAEVKRNEKIRDRSGPYDSKLHHFVLTRNAKAVVKRWDERNEARQYDMELHILRLGDSVICTNPFELFLDYGLQIKARSPAARTFVTQLACGTGGYLPTPAAELHGGYGGLIINGKVGAAGGKKLVEETLKDIYASF